MQFLTLTIAALSSLLTLTTGCMETRLIYDAVTQQVLSGYINDNGIKVCHISLKKLSTNVLNAVPLTCKGGYSALVRHLGSKTFDMEVHRGGETLEFGLHTACGTDLNIILGDNQVYCDSVNAYMYSLTAANYGC